ncbi:hypothetical protein ACEWY4_007697 [Coilia grayii]|uniref:Gypsy retrotransposon integrase-like protein 1 n=1 Tax=Coilia grayii TaxID=363190 RepID=A0ABD1K8S8_9TELE
MVPVSCPQLDLVDFLLEPPSFEEEQLPEGLLMSPTLVCARKGLLYAPVVNVNKAEVWLSPRRVIGTVQAVTATPVRSSPITVEPCWGDCCAFVSAQKVSPPGATPDLVPDLAGLTQQQAAQAQSLFARNNQNADALSRQYLERFSFGTAVPALGALEERFRSTVMGAHCEEVTALPWDRLVEREGLMYCLIQASGNGPEVLQLLLPQCLQEEVLRSVHDDQGHQKVERTLQLLRARSFWPNMARDVERWCQKCQRCVLGKVVLPKVRAYWGTLQAGWPNEILAMDFTSLDPASDGRENVLVLTDVFTKYAQAIPTQDQKATIVARTLV